MSQSPFEPDLTGSFEDFAERLNKFISIERKYVEGSLVIALTAKFGSGKTTFLQMWASFLEQHQYDEEQKKIIVQLNAWESDYIGDPLFAIISELISSIASHDDKKNADKIVSAAKDVGWFFTAIGGQVAKKFSGVDPAGAGDFADKKKAARENEISVDAFSMFESRKKAMENLKKSVIRFITEGNYEVLFLIDELDRCRPDYAISYLEAIKHIFDIKGATFLLATDRQQLENSAKKAFGSDLNFDEYYRKFIHREIALPSFSAESYHKLVKNYYEKYLLDNEIRCCFYEKETHYPVDLTLLVCIFTLTPRQIQEAFRILGHVLAVSDKEKSIYRDVSPTIFMILLKIDSSEYYEKLGTRQIEPVEAFNWLNGLFGYGTEYIANSAMSWFVDLLISGAIKKEERGELAPTVDGEVIKERVSNELESYKKIFNQVGMSYSKKLGNSPLDTVRNFLERTAIERYSGRSPVSSYQKVYERIEQISNWD